MWSITPNPRPRKRESRLSSETLTEMRILMLLLRMVRIVCGHVMTKTHHETTLPPPKKKRKSYKNKLRQQ